MANLVFSIMDPEWKKNLNIISRDEFIDFFKENKDF